MARYLLEESQIHPAVRETVHGNHRDIVEEAIRATQENKVVVLGMGQNPYCKKARRFLDGKGIGYTYLEHGNYFTLWRRRNALKMWTGWPTFPMVFVGGILIGGHADLEALARKGELDRLIAEGPV